MTTENRYWSIAVAAGADLTPAASLHKAVAIGGTIASTNQNAVGLLKSKGKTGEGVRLGYFGEMKAYAGASITIGDRLMITTSGFVILGTSGTLPIGKALETANSGDLFRGIFNFTQGLTT